MKARGLAAGALLTVAAVAVGSWVSLPVHADETPAPTLSATPSPAPAFAVVAERGPRCGTVRVQLTGTPVELWRAETPTRVEGADMGPGLWVRQPRDAADRIDEVAGPWATYQATSPEDLTTVYSVPVKVEPCSPSPTPPVGATPGPGTSPAPTPTTPPAGVSTPSHDREGGLAKTGW